MTLKPIRIPAAIVFGSMLLASSSFAQNKPAAPESAYGGVVVEEIVARINDQIITRSDYDRAMKEMDDEARQHGATMQQISEGHKDLLRGLIDQQLWLSKGKELGINGETELIQRLNEYRKQYNLETIEDLEKAAKEQGVSYEDFKANIRNQIITQQVMRDEVGRKIQFTPGEVQRYFDEHKQDYAQPESVRLSEILIASSPSDDDAKQAAAKAKAADIEAKLHQGGDFTQLAKSFSDGSTAGEGGNLGQYKRGELNKALEDDTFALKTGQYTDPILTKQGLVIFKVTQHAPGGVPEFKDVEQDVEQNFYETRMMPAIRQYLTQMREEAAIDIKPGYVDTGASTKETKLTYSAYTPPVVKKKKKVERTRFRETTRTFRQKSTQAAAPAPVATPATKKNASLTSQKPGKKEKIRFGQAPSKTLPTAAGTKVEDAGGGDQTASADTPPNPLEAKEKPTEKTRFSARAKTVKQPKAAPGAKVDPLAPAAADSAEVADRQTQSAPLGLAGDTAAKKKKKDNATSGDKTRLTQKKKTPAPAPEITPAPTVPGAPAPAPPAPSAPTPAPQQ
ncbi:MAG: peptidyl-prolyl cis-trans isomerase [Terracidiphilus sp.]|jgi:peptidyl-prolyl cis-trans isomerase SurA